MWDLVHLIFPERSDKITYSLKIQSRPSFGSYLGRNWESLVVPTPSPPLPTSVQRKSVPSASIFFLPFFLFSFSFFFLSEAGGGRGSEGGVPLHLWCPVKSKEIPPHSRAKRKILEHSPKKKLFYFDYFIIKNIYWNDPIFHFIETDITKKEPINK